MGGPPNNSGMTPPFGNGGNWKAGIQTKSSFIDSAHGSSLAPGQPHSTRASLVTGEKPSTQQKPTLGLEEALAISRTSKNGSANPREVHHGVLLAPFARPTTSIIKNSPHSKTSIARITYQLEDLPALFIAEVETTCSPASLTHGQNDEWSVVKNRKIRKDALKEIVSQGSIAEHATDIAIIQNANGTMDHLIAPCAENMPVLEQELKVQHKFLTHTKKLAKKADAQSGADIDRSIACNIREKTGRLSEEQKVRLYWGSLCAFLRMRASQADYQSGDRIQAEFMQRFLSIIDHSNKIDPFEGFGQEVAAGLGSGLSIGLRITPSFSVEHKRLHLDFDLTPRVPKGFLHKNLFDVFGKHRFTSNPSEYIEVLRDLFLGLEVRCAYTPPSRVSQIQGSKATLLDEEHASRGRSFCIDDFKMPEKVSRFNVGNAQLSVSSYFNKRVLPNNRTLQFPELPLVSDGKHHWIPLEMLIVAHSQTIQRRRFLNATRKIAQGVLHLDYEPAIGGFGQEFLNRINVRKWPAENNSCDKLFEIADNVVFLPSVRNTAPLPVAKLTQKPVTMFPHDAASLGIIEDKSAIGISDTDLIGKLQQSFRAPRTTERSFSIKNQNHQVFRVAKDFTEAKPNSDASNVLQPYPSKPKLVIGVMEESSGIAKHLRKYADLEKHVLLLNVGKTHLRERYSTSGENSDYCPLNLRLKMNFLLGGTNFDNKVLHLKSRSDLGRLMIVGLHIKRPTTGIETYAPSIATVVASTNGTALQYPGSFRIQPTFNEYREYPKGKRIIVKGKIDSAIPDFEEMMIERFRAWSDDQGHPTAILVYRDSIVFDDNEIWYEYEKIKEAHKKSFLGMKPALITFVVLNKNALVTFVPPVESPMPVRNEHKVPATPQMVFGTEIGPQKNKYYVMKNESGFTEEELRALTININKSSQLSPQDDQVARALPLIYASKLSARIHDYFDDSFPEEMKKQVSLVDGDHAAKMKKATELACEHLGLNAQTGRGNPWGIDHAKRMFYL